MFSIIVRGLLLGVGLSMDAFAVSIADGLKENKMPIFKVLFIALMFGFFQGAMPLVSYFMGSMLFDGIDVVVPYLALILLGVIGGKMIFSYKDDSVVDDSLSFKIILAQAIATSLDALTVGFTIANYNVLEALLSAFLIMIVTFVFCSIGVLVGEKCSKNLASKGQVFGGILLIVIGVEIFIKGIFF